MQSWILRDLRSRVGDGERLEQPDAIALLDALDIATRAAKIPTEFVVRVSRDGDLERWTAHHPLFRATMSASHPADALVLGAQELRRALVELGVDANPAETAASRRHLRGADITREVAETHRATADDAVGESLDWALGEIDRLTSDVRLAEGRNDILESAASGDPAARERLRRDALTAFEHANVHASAASWSTDALGDAANLGIELPVLVVAVDITRHDRIADWRFTDDREWFALRHQVEPRPMSRYVDRVVSPLRTSDTTELALRRLAARVPTGRSVGAYVEFASLVADELPGVDVSRLDAPLSPAWVPLPTSAIPVLCGGTEDQDLDLDTLAEHDGWGPWFSNWSVAWVTDHLGESMF